MSTPPEWNRHLPPPRVLTAQDLALLLDIGVETARKYLREGRLPAVRLGRRWYASREAVVDRLEILAEERQADEQGEPAR